MRLRTANQAPDMIVVTLWQVLKHQITNYSLAVPYDNAVAARWLSFDRSKVAEL